MNIETTATNVIVVGAGIAGLSVAAYLARAGIDVTVLEQAIQPGGRAAGRVSDGYCFNHGIHALFSGGAASSVLAELGITYTYGAPKTTYALQNGRIAVFPTHPLALLRSPLLDTGDKLALARLVPAISAAAPQELAGVSVADWLADMIRRPRLRQLFAAVARTAVYTTALDLVSAEVFVDKFQHGLRYPIQYIDGGWQILVDRLRRAAERDGAQVVAGTHVDAVVHAAGRARGVRLGNGDFLPAAAVVVAASPREAAKLIAADTAPALHATINARLAAPLACLDVALRRLPNPGAPVVQDLDRPRFMSAQSQYARVAPDGGAMISSFKQLDPRRLSDPHHDERELEDLLDTAQPGWRDLLVRRVYLPRIEAVGMLPTVAQGGFAGRPTTQASGIANLLLAGDWIGPHGFLVDASFASARSVAQQLIASRPKTVVSHELIEA